MVSTSTGAEPSAIYTASVNPPRRAKRARASCADDTDDEFDEPASPLAVRTILPKMTPAAAKPLAPSSSPKATRQPGSTHGGSLSRAQRESLRKQNHSRIEKARRTKINCALAELRILVPKDVAIPLEGEDFEDEEDFEDDADYGGSRKRGQAKPRAEKEFKLEVLVRTVAYLKTLVHRVDTLEQQAVDQSPACTRCFGEQDAEDFTPPSKRQCLSPLDHREDLDTDMVLPPFAARSAIASRTITPAESLRPSPSPRLPPISSWLPLLPYAEPSSLAVLATTPRTQAAKYPSPPPSDLLPPRATAAPPALTLPPARSALSSAERDSDAASLLLRLRVPGSTGSSLPQGTLAQTPASLLGLRR